MKERWQVSMNWLYGTPLPQLYAPATNSELNTMDKTPNSLNRARSSITGNQSAPSPTTALTWLCLIF
ncbi:MAG: hypothetical protein R2788_21660 [Saprospiraceae bacterium]